MSARPNAADPVDEGLSDGSRVGRFLVVRDIDGRRHAVASGSVAAIFETEDGVLILLPGERVIHLPQSMAVLLDWVDGRR